MEKEKKKVYMRPVSVCTVVSLESPICSGSDFEVQSPHGDSGIDAQPVDVDFSNANNFSDGSWT